MVTRNLECPACGMQTERIALRLIEPDRTCTACGHVMNLMPTAPAGFQFKGQGFHKVDYPKSNEEKIKDFGLVEHDSTKPNSDYHQDGYAEEMVSKVPGTAKPKGG